MKLDMYTTAPRPDRIDDIARTAESTGFAGLWVTETGHNPYIAAALAAKATDELMIGTDVAIALVRSPMVTAQAAWDIAAISGGRFVLGLGTQVKAHLERRFSVSAERPAARLREYVLALRAIFDAFQGRSPLRFEGEFYRFSLLTPYFDPGPIDHPDIPVYVAGVNERLAETAGEVADGFCAHPVNSPRYLSEVVRASIEEGAKRARRDAGRLTVVAPVLVNVGDDDADVERQRDATRLQIGFYGTTPSYRRLFEVHGWDDLPDRLRAAAKTGDQARLAAEVSDDVLDTYSVTATWDTLADALVGRFDGLADRIFPYAAVGLDGPEGADRWAAVAAAVARSSP